MEETNSEEDFLTKYLDPKDRSRQIPVKPNSHLDNLISTGFFLPSLAILSSGHKNQLNACCQVETSMKYMDSVAFKKAYGEEPLWVKYRRNHKRQFAPKTRETCIR